MIWRLKQFIKQHLPKPILRGITRSYHFSLALFGAFLYGFPSKKLVVIGVTGTKGKSSTTELINAIFEAAGYKTVLINSIRFKVNDTSDRNTTRMSMPGRFFIQEMLAHGVRVGCTVAIIEMTSEGSRQYRHRGIALDALVFTNLAPEHIESHGSLAAYANAKYEFGLQLLRSSKRPRIMVANADDGQSGRFLALPVEMSIPFSLAAQTPFASSPQGGFFTIDNERIDVPLPGDFSLKNALAAALLARAFQIDMHVIRAGIAATRTIAGRAERIECGQDFTVVIDYAHTPDSLRAIYDAYKGTRRVCVLGSTGGGRDVWKRAVMGSIADTLCDTVILTNEDPYDEDPRSIVDMLAHDMKRTPTIIMDRREAIRHALSLARTGDAILITGKGTDPTIQGAGGTSIPWSDKQVATEELQKILARHTV